MSGDPSDNEVKEVRMEKIQSSITCPLCELPFIEATTINECIHTFCKRCIYDKITNENLKVCPVCNVELGTTPLSKLRSDNNLQVLCDIILASAGKKSEEMLSKVPISYLVDNIPKSSNHNITKKRSKRTKTKRGEQSSHNYEASSSNPPTENVIPQIIKGNDGGIEIARLPERILSYDLNKLLTIIVEDESNPKSIVHNVIDELKVEDKDADPNNIEDEITNAEDGITNVEDEITNAEDEMTNVEDKITNAATIREIDLNEPLNPPTTEENTQIFYLNKNENTNEPPNQPVEEDAPTHDHNKNEAITPSDTPDKENEIFYIIIDDSD